MSDYAGPERRQGHLDMAGALADVRDLRASVVALTEVASHMVPREEIDQRFYDERNQRRQVILTAFGLTIIIAALAIVNFIVIGELDRNAKEARLGTLCLIEQLAEHREQTSAHIADTAAALGRPAPPSGNVPPPVPTDLKESCEAFFPPFPPGPPEIPDG